jgi:hypothetical protein
MDTVYKYCGANGLKILRNLELKVTPPNQFNDPFEFTPKMNYSDPVGYAKKNLQEESVLKWLYEHKRAEGKFAGSFQEFQERASAHQTEVIEAFVSVLPLGAAQAEKEFLDEVSRRFGILCMSQKRDSILMWGHYCDKPLGLVIGFDKSAAIFQQEKGLRPVNYVKERVAFDACWPAGSPELLKYEEDVILSKSDAWLYEQEVRQFFALSSHSLTKKLLEDKTTGYFLPFPAEAIVSVTLGPRCLPDLENEVRELLQKPHFSNMKKFDHAILHENNFSIDFEPMQLTP